MAEPCGQTFRRDLSLGAQDQRACLKQCMQLQRELVEEKCRRATVIETPREQTLEAVQKLTGWEKKFTEHVMEEWLDNVVRETKWGTGVRTRWERTGSPEWQTSMMWWPAPDVCFRIFTQRRESLSGGIEGATE